MFKSKGTPFDLNIFFYGLVRGKWKVFKPLVGFLRKKTGK